MRRFVATAFTLQWGRALMSAESCPRVRLNVPLLMLLQWGRALMSAESGAYQHPGFQRSADGSATDPGYWSVGKKQIADARR